MYLQRPAEAWLERSRPVAGDPVRMKNRPSKSTRGARQAPLDHLRPGGRPRTDSDAAGQATGPDSNRTARVSDPRPAQPAEPATPGSGDADAMRGKATGSPAAVATRPHLEGSEQNPG
jgi:hypothetical protein